MYKQTYFKWCHYFLFMLAGVIVGKNKDSISKYPIGYVIGFTLFSIIFFYGIQIVGSKSTLVANFQILTLIPLLGIVYGFYLIARSNILYQLYKQRIYNWLITTIGGLCLELYIVQMPILTGNDGVLPFGYYRDDLLYLFPLNIPVLVIVVFLMAYLTRIVGRLFCQTFDSIEGYRWNMIFGLK